MNAKRTRVSGAGARLISLLVDLGHIDIDTADELVLALTDTASPSGRIAVDEVRRMLAAHLWDSPSLKDNEGPLAQDWALFFG
ncbi:MAG: hypothetical protein EP330_08425 [Deltaproteobacteria bacterium]|nr:MAG: hypothetical protein EP330_08425 [Deltaproteobacteria bacterium]